jgi:hypothetical protein
MKVQLIFAWYDLWIGAFYDKKKNWIYIFPIPMFGVILKLPKTINKLRTSYNQRTMNAEEIKRPQLEDTRIPTSHQSVGGRSVNIYAYSKLQDEYIDHLESRIKQLEDALNKIKAK